MDDLTYWYYKVDGTVFNPCSTATEAANNIAILHLEFHCNEMEIGSSDIIVTEDS